MEFLAIVLLVLCLMVAFIVSAFVTANREDYRRSWNR